jgi:eukaryotic-like serine/threonine-protein kinase
MQLASFGIGPSKNSGKFGNYKMVIRRVDSVADTSRGGESGNDAIDPLQPLVIAVQEAVAAGMPLPPIDDAPLSDAERSRFGSLCALIKSLHRLREPLEMDSQRSIVAPTAMNFAGLAGPKGRVGRFEIDRLLGHGGHGVVYLAFDPILNRLVAVKIPRPEVLVDPEMRERFLREARSAASLDHPNIVSIYEAGTTGEVCFIAIAYCSGGSLAEFLGKQPGALSRRGCARLFMQLAEALDYTHVRGILHLDLKPANILLFPLTEDSAIPRDSSGDWPPFIPKLTDFGLARIIEESAARTRTSLAGGTPLYMSPEQAGQRPDDVDGRSDVHALGLVMYEALTGKRPFDGDSLLSVLEAVRHRQPTAPHHLVSAVPRDLSTICMKCLEKRPARRYQSAAALAADLRRFLNHEPIEAKRNTRAEQWFLWCQRRPAVAASIAFSMLVFVGALVGYLLHHQQITNLDALNRASEYSRLVNETKELVARPRIGWSWDGLDTLRETLTHDVPTRDVVTLRSAAAAFLTGTDLRQVASIAPGIRGYSVAFSPDGSQLAIGDNNNADSGNVPVEIWDFATRKQLRHLTFPLGRGKGGQLDGVRSLLFTRNGRRLIAGSRQGEIHVWDLTTSPPNRRDWQPHTGWVTFITELDNGEVLSASEDATMRRLNLSSGEVGVAQRLNAPVSDMRIGTIRTADGSQQVIVAAGVDERLRILSWPKGEILANWRLPLLPGQKLLGPFVDRNAQIVACGQSICEVDLEHGTILHSFNDSDVGRAHDGEVRSLDRAHDGEVRSFDLSPDGLLLASGGADGRVKLWDMATGTLVSNLFLSTADNIAVKFHPGGRYLIAANGLESRILEVSGGHLAGVVAMQRSAICGFAVSERGLLTIAQPLPTEPVTETGLNANEGANGPLKLKCLTAHVKSLPFINPTDDRNDTALCGDWQQPVSVTVHPKQPIWASFGGGTFFELRLEDQRREVFVDELQAISFSPDGNYLWATYSAKTAEFDKSIGALGAWRVSDRSKAAEWLNLESKRQGRMNGLHSLAVGKTWLAVTSSDETVKLFRPDVPKPTLVNTIAIDRDRADSLAFDPAESLLAVGTRRGNLILVQPGSKRKSYESQQHTDMISSVAFSSNGRLLATGSYDRSIRMWLVRNDKLEPILSLPRQSNRILKVAFGPGGDVLYVLVQNETALRTFRLNELHDALGRLHLGWN